jgi:uncharacterized protein YbaP (TraB family)
LQAADAHDRGALWRIASGGRRSYLFGTLHVGRAKWVVPGPRVRAALAESDTVALEIDPMDPALSARLSTPRPGAPAALPAALELRVARHLDAACLPDSARPTIDRQHPLMRAITLTVLEARWEGLDPAYGQDIMLAGFARAAQRRIVSLESPERQLDALMPRSDGELQHDVASALDQLDSGAARRAVAHLAAAWERGDLGDLEQYEQWCECVLDDDDRRLLHRLLDERNPDMAQRIEALHREGRRVFVGVGMLHMIGPKGLPALLRARGFSVERVAYPAAPRH